MSVVIMYSKDEVIKETITFGLFSDESKHGCYVAFGVNSEFVKASIVAMLSFIKNNDGVIFNFNIVTSGINEGDIKNINEVDLKGSVISVHLINNSIFDGYQEKENLPISMYYRLLIPHVLLDYTDKILYVDADTLCLNSISELFSFNFGSNIIAAVEDSGSAADNARDKSICNNGYFNSGVMLINTKKWVTENIVSKFNEMIFSDNYQYPDQDVLNIILSGNVMYLDGKYNTFFSSGNASLDYTVIVHFVGSPKPWVSWCENNQLYLDYYNITPWKNCGLELPKTYKQCKSYAAQLRKQRKYVLSMFWFCKYLLKKIKKN